ncbi:MAG: Lrp/AsnC family transcriptional regulator [Geodermatophilaceae bacterium]|nr:Lrp/AsnC family transcriptional regulator [Geodermatophilaceae bacterium]MDQ3465587.1 Lrp/AsnC family transcriptional regulator [Actinomycetota bacterium]
MDAVDRSLLHKLRANARATYADLARQVGLSAPAVHERVGKLEASGIITGYHATVAPAAVGLDVTALVGVFESDHKAEQDLSRALAQMLEIEDCWFVAGEESFLLKVRVADMPALEHAIAAISRLPGVSRTRTTVVLSTRWEGRVPSGEDPSTDVRSKPR